MNKKNKNIEISVEIRRISMWITPCKRSATRGMKPSISVEIRRISMWITPCKRSATRGKTAYHTALNSVGVQPKYI